MHTYRRLGKTEKARQFGDCGRVVVGPQQFEEDGQARRVGKHLEATGGAFGSLAALNVTHFILEPRADNQNARQGPEELPRPRKPKGHNDKLASLARTLNLRLVLVLVQKVVARREHAKIDI